MRLFLRIFFSFMAHFLSDVTYSPKNTVVAERVLISVGSSDSGAAAGTATSGGGRVSTPRFAPLTSLNTDGSVKAVQACVDDVASLFANERFGLTPGRESSALLELYSSRFRTPAGCLKAV